MRAGSLNRRITIEQATESQDSYGQPIETWAAYVTRWAQILPQGGREFYNAQQVNAELTTIFRLRLDKSITAKMRVSYDSRILDIVSAQHNEDYRETTLLCKEWDE